MEGEERREEKKGMEGKRKNVEEMMEKKKKEANERKWNKGKKKEWNEKNDRERKKEKRKYASPFFGMCLDLCLLNRFQGAVMFDSFSSSWLLR